MKFGVGFGAERIGLAAIRWPKLGASLLIAFLVLIGLSLPNIRFDDDINRVFLSDSAVSQAQIAYRNEGAGESSVVLAYVQSERRFSAAQLNTLRDVALDLEFLENVSGVASPFALRFPPNTENPKGTPVFDVEIDADYADSIDAFRALETGLPTFVAPSFNAMLIAVRLELGTVPMDDLLTSITAEFERVKAIDLKVSFTGEDVISLEIVNGLKSDLIALNIWGCLLVGFAALVLLRDLRMVLLAVIPALSGAASVLALSVWLGYPINVLSNVIPILILVLGMADAVHLAGHIKATGESARETVKRIGPACALTAITTSLAFACIMVTSNEQLFEFAVLGALGTLLAFGVVITSFAILALVIKPIPRATPKFTSGIADRLSNLGTRAPRVVIGGAFVLLLVSVIGFQQTKAWFPLYQNLPKSSETAQMNDAIAAEFGGVFQMIIEVEGDWEKASALVGDLTKLAGTEAVLSEVAVARWLGVEGRQPSVEEQSAVPDDLKAQLRAKEGAHRIFVWVPEPMRDAASLAHYDALYRAAEVGGASRILGLPTVMRFEAVNLISQLSRGLVLAAIGATFVVAIAFGSLRLFPLLLVPNILPLMITGASLHFWAAGQLSPTAVLALTISFGIAIDDSVHFVNRFFEARKQGKSANAAVDFAARSAGQVMVLTTVLLTFGLAVTQISDFFPIRLFGGMMIITLWAALLFDLVLLPALLGRKERLNA
ncbi:efflux RND transporter permease subunit [Planktotalea sp.]|uniref:efflux RND transporter permease subunit n=1 Tax=Planktotalea sp. TaxID=2029877 RepID=UPI003D6C1545